MDATPITLGQEISGYAAQLNMVSKRYKIRYPIYLKLLWEEPQLVQD
jgi:fumarate hydratase class II